MNHSPGPSIWTTESLSRPSSNRVFYFCSSFLLWLLQRWRELWQKSDYEEWLYRRPQLPGGVSDDDDNGSNSIYELPERVSSSRPMSTYYSSATILASDSATYSAYYWWEIFFWFLSIAYFWFVTLKTNKNKCCCCCCWRRGGSDTRNQTDLQLKYKSRFTLYKAKHQ